MAPPPPITYSYRYWRFYITASTLAGSVGFSEIELRGSVGGVDITAPATPVTASSYFNVYAPFKVVNNNNAVFDQWLATDALPQWLYVDLANPTQVAEVMMRGEDSTSPSSPSAFLIQGSNDAITWFTVKTLTGLPWGASETKLFTL